MEPTVELTGAARSWAKSANTCRYLAFRPEGDARTVLPLFREAIRAADDAESPAQQQAGRVLVDGPNLLIRLRETPYGTRLPWLERLVEHLAVRGLAGRFTKPRERWSGRMESLGESSRLMVFFAGRNAVSERWVRVLLDLMMPMAVNVQVSAGLHAFSIPVDDDLPATVLDLAETTTGLFLNDSDDDVIADMNVTGRTTCAFSVSEKVLATDRQLDVFRAMIRDLAADLDVAWIGRRRPGGETSISVYAPVVEPPGDRLVPEVYMQVPAAWSRSVPDVQGIQLLGPAHLAAAHDLTRWRTTPLPGGRALVEAPDLGAWYGADPPSEATLAQARADFGDLIVRDYLSLPRG